MKLLARRGPWLTLLAALLAVGLGSRGGFELDRSAVFGGQWWRVFTCELVHYGRPHAAADLLAFCGWAAVVEWRSRRLLAYGMAASLLVIGPAILLCCPGVTHFRGLSGMELALATLVLLVLATSPRVRRLPALRWLVVAAAVVYVAKLVFELCAGHGIFASDLADRGRALPAAHMFGALAGLVAFVLWMAQPRRRRTTSSPSTPSRTLAVPVRGSSSSASKRT